MTTHNILITNNMDILGLPFQELTNITDQVASCESTINFDNSNNYIVHKKCKNPDIEIFLTMKNGELIRGYLYQYGIEYEVKQYVLYKSIQMGSWAYDMLGICYYS